MVTQSGEKSGWPALSKIASLMSDARDLFHLLVLIILCLVKTIIYSYFIDSTQESQDSSIWRTSNNPSCVRKRFLTSATRR